MIDLDYETMLKLARELTVAGIRMATVTLVPDGGEDARKHGPRSVIAYGTGPGGMTCYLSIPFQVVAPQGLVDRLSEE